MKFRGGTMAGLHSLALGTILLLLLCCCSSVPEPVSGSVWYQDRLREAKAHNEAKPDVIGSKEVWIGTVVGTVGKEKGIRILPLKDCECLYSAEKSFFGGYCRQSRDHYFTLETQFLKTPLESGDRIVFSAAHTERHYLGSGAICPNPDRKTCGDRIVESAAVTVNFITGKSGKTYPHPIDISRMAKIDPAAGRLVPIEYDSDALHKKQQERRAFHTLCTACQKGVNELEEALKNGNDPNVPGAGFPDKTFFTMVLRWEREITPEHIRLLLKYKADPVKADGTGQTPLMAAALNETHPAVCCRLLLEAGADPNQLSDCGKERPCVSAENLPPLFTAVRRNHLALAELLLEHKADPLLCVRRPVPIPALPHEEQPVFFRPVDEVKDHRMAELLLKYIKKDVPVYSPVLMDVLREKKTASVPVTE